MILPSVCEASHLSLERSQTSTCITTRTCITTAGDRAVVGQKIVSAQIGDKLRRPVFRGNQHHPLVPGLIGREHSVSHRHSQFERHVEAGEVVQSLARTPGQIVYGKPASKQGAPDSLRPRLTDGSGLKRASRREST